MSPDDTQPDASPAPLEPEVCENWPSPCDCSYCENRRAAEASHPREPSRLVHAIRRAAWTIVHDVIAHPVCGMLWAIAGVFGLALLKRAGDFLHEVTLPPMSLEDMAYVHGKEGA